MPDPIQHSLTNEHCACLDRVLQRTPAALNLAQVCEDCGWDVSAAKATLEEQQDMARKAKAALFPTRT